MDWPLSREEKKSQIIRLYDQDVQAAERQLNSDQRALEALQQELDSIRRASSLSNKARRDEEGWAMGPDEARGMSAEESARLEADRLHKTVENAAAVLRALAILQKDACERDEFRREAAKEERHRSRSEDVDRRHKPLKPALCRTPRSSRGGGGADGAKQVRRVSFGDEQAKCRSPSDSEPGTPPSGQTRERAEPEPEQGQSEDQPSTPRPPQRSRIRELWVPIGEDKIGMNVPVDKVMPERVGVNSVTSGTWAQAQGIQVGDMLIAIGGCKLLGMEKFDFCRIIKERPLKVTVESKSTG